MHSKSLSLNFSIAKAVIIISLFLFLIACNKKQEDTSSVLSVTVTSPQMQDLHNIISVNGTISAWQETIISAEVTGLDISAVYVNVGDHVHKGDKLAQLNPAQVNADLMQQKANLSEAKANLEQSQTEARQATILEKAGAVSSQDLLQYTTKSRTNQAKLEAAEAVLKLQKLKLSYTLITAPDDGVISARSATLGSIVQSGNELFRLIRSSRLEWQAQASPEDIQKIKPGQAANIINNDGTVIIAKVRQVSPVLNQNTRNGMVYVDLPSNTNLRQGEYLAGTIDLGIVRSMTVPTSALINRDGYNYVMRVSPENKIIQTKVKVIDLHDYNAKYASIQSSEVKLSDKIVTLGSGFLSSGDSVHIVNGSDK